MTQATHEGMIIMVRFPRGIGVIAEKKHKHMNGLFRVFLRKINLGIIILLLFGKPIILFSQIELKGSWEGELDLGPHKLPLVVHIDHKDGKLNASMDSPNQNAFGIPVSEMLCDGLMLMFRLEGLGASYEGVWNGSGFQGQFHQSGMGFALELKKSEKAQHLSFPKPQEPTPPYPYELISTTFISNGVALRGILTKPNGEGPFPAVVLVSGSGPQDRNAEIYGHKPFLVIADFLTRNGLAVLRYDERGVGESEGEFDGSTTQDFAEDATAALEKLRTFDFTNNEKTGLMGHSEGGLIAWMLAAKNLPDFIIAMAAPVVPILEVMTQQTFELSLGTGMDPELAEEQAQLNNLLYRTVLETEDAEKGREELSRVLWNVGEKKGLELEQLDQFHQQMLEAYSPLVDPWFNSFIKINPEDWIKDIRIPVFAAFGEKDQQVNAGSNMAKLIKALPPSRKHRMEIYPELNHLFQSSITGAIAEYAELSETFNHHALKDVLEWVRGLE
jgi:uncharacterized protein